MQKDILQKWFFQQAPGEVWAYLTQPELIEQWLAKNDFKPVAGHQFQFINDPKIADDKDHNAYCRVLEVIPYQLLSYSWRKGTGKAAVDSVVTWTLTGKNGGTVLQLQHTGFTLVEDIIAHSGGWEYCLNKMTGVLNSSSNTGMPLAALK